MPHPLNCEALGGPGDGGVEAVFTLIVAEKGRQGRTQGSMRGAHNWLIMGATQGLVSSGVPPLTV